MSNQPPLVSVCIANYNGEHMLVECIDSVLQQSSDTEVEIIVHDDASTDGSIALLGTRYPAVRVIHSDVNVGFCIANNRMADVARGEFLLLLNNDAALFPDAIQTLLEDARDIGSDAIASLPQYDWSTGDLVDRGCLLDPFHVPVPSLDPEREEVAYVIGACLWIPRAAWQRLGGFPECFGSIAEDLYLGCAARLQGMPVRCLARSGYRHRQGVSFGGNRAGTQGLRTNYRRRYLSERNRIAVLVTCVPTLLAWPWMTVHGAALVVEGLLLSSLSRDPRIWREIYGAALRDAWKARRTLLGLRARTLAGRKASLARVLAPYCWLPWKLALLRRHGLPRVG